MPRFVEAAMSTSTRWRPSVLDSLSGSSNVTSRLRLPPPVILAFAVRSENLRAASVPGRPILPWRTGELGAWSLTSPDPSSTWIVPSSPRSPIRRSRTFFRSRQWLHVAHATFSAKPPPARARANLPPKRLARFEGSVKTPTGCSISRSSNCLRPVI